MKQQERTSYIDPTGVLTLSLAVLTAAFAYLCRIHAFDLDESGFIFWRALTVSVCAFLWLAIRLVLAIRE
jgi:hypothetical protein